MTQRRNIVSPLVPQRGRHTHEMSPSTTLKQAFITGLSLVLILSIGTQARAQGRQTGTLRGTAQDSTAAVLPGVTVTVTSDALQGSRTTVTDLNGNYEIIGLPPGQYTASFALQGFTSVDAPSRSRSAEWPR